MRQYEITEMIIDHQLAEEYVTTEFTYHNNLYSVTFKKADLELINMWLLKDGTSLPANLPEELLTSIRDDIKQKM